MTDDAWIDPSPNTIILALKSGELSADYDKRRTPLMNAHIRDIATIFNNDWATTKPPGCECNTIAQVIGCYNRCDDSLYDRTRSSQSPPIYGIIIACAIAIIVAAGLANYRHLLPHTATGITIDAPR